MARKKKGAGEESAEIAGEEEGVTSLEEAAALAEGAEEETEEKPEEAEAAEAGEAGTAEAEPGEAAAEVEEEAAPKKKKRAVRIRKARKEREHPLAAAVRLAVESGRTGLGFRRAARDALSAKAKAFVLASRMPQGMRESIERYARLSEIPLIYFEGTPLELGSVCGKPFNVSVVSVYEEGTSNILELARKKK